MRREHRRGADRQGVREVAAHGAKSFLVGVKVPASLKKGTYYVAACTPQGGADKGALGCATSAARPQDQGRRPGARQARASVDVQNGGAPQGARRAGPLHARRAHARPSRATASGRSSATAATRALHTDVFINLRRGRRTSSCRARTSSCTQQLDAVPDASSASTSTARTASRARRRAGPGHDGRSSITINGAAGDVHVQAADLPRRPERPGRSRPARARTACNTNPVIGDQPEPAGLRADQQQRRPRRALPCGDTKLVITPARRSRPARLQGRRQLHGPPGHPRRTRRSATRAGSATTPRSATARWSPREPSGTMAWMPLNNHASVKPTYDIHSTVNYDPARRAGVEPRVHRQRPPRSRRSSTRRTRTSRRRLAHVQLALGRADRAPTWSRTASATSTSPSAWRRPATSSTTSTRAPTSPPPARRTNKAIMDMQEDITHFQEQFNGPFPFNANGIVVAAAERLLRGGDADEDRVRRRQHRHHRARRSATRTCTSGGATRSPTRSRKYTFFKEGYADMSRVPLPGRRRRPRPPAPVGSAAYNAAFEASIVTRFNGHHRTTRPARRSGASRRRTRRRATCSATRTPTPARARPTSRCGRSSATDNFRQGQHGDPDDLPRTARSRRSRRSRSSTSTCRTSRSAARTSSTRSSSSGGTRPTRARRRPATSRRSPGPGLAGGGFYDANGGCSDYGTDVPVDAGGDRPGDARPDARRAGDASAPFTPGVAKDYTATTTANVISTAGDATLSVVDPSAPLRATWSTARSACRRR